MQLSAFETSSTILYILFFFQIWIKKNSISKSTEFPLAMFTRRFHMFFYTSRRISDNSTSKSEFLYNGIEYPWINILYIILYSAIVICAMWNVG